MASSNTAYQVYKTRWYVLALYFTTTTLTSYSLNQYCILTDVIAQYYDVSEVWVTYTSNVANVVYVALVVFCDYILKRFGVRVSLLLGSAFNAASAIVKVFTLDADRSVPIMVAQVLVSLAQVLLLGMSALLASVWFGAAEVSTAVAIGTQANTFGFALSNIIPPFLIPSNGTATVRSGLKTINVSNAGISCAVLLLALVYFPAKPKTEPSKSHENATSAQESMSYRQSILILFKNRNFLLMFTSYGLLIGVYFAFTIVINRLLVPYGYTETTIGVSGFVGAFSGILGAIVSGYWLDRRHTYKLTYVLSYAGSALLMVAFTFLIPTRNDVILYVILILLSISINAAVPAGFELTIEVCYPVSEGTIANLLLCSLQAVGFVYAIALGYLLDEDGQVVTSNLISSAILTLGTILAVFVQNDLRRSKAEETTEEGIALY